MEQHGRLNARNPYIGFFKHAPRGEQPYAQRVLEGHHISHADYLRIKALRRNVHTGVFHKAPGLYSTLHLHFLASSAHHGRGHSHAASSTAVPVDGSSEAGLRASLASDRSTGSDALLLGPSRPSTVKIGFGATATCMPPSLTSPSSSTGGAQHFLHHAASARVMPSSARQDAALKLQRERSAPAQDAAHAAAVPPPRLRNVATVTGALDAMLMHAFEHGDDDVAGAYYGVSDASADEDSPPPVVASPSRSVGIAGHSPRRRSIVSIGMGAINVDSIRKPPVSSAVTAVADASSVRIPPPVPVTRTPSLEDASILQQRAVVAPLSVVTRIGNGRVTTTFPNLHIPHAHHPHADSAAQLPHMTSLPARAHAGHASTQEEVGTTAGAMLRHSASAPAVDTLNATHVHHHPTSSSGGMRAGMAANSYGHARPAAVVSIGRPLVQAPQASSSPLLQLLTTPSTHGSESDLQRFAARADSMTEVEACASPSSGGDTRLPASFVVDGVQVNSAQKPSVPYNLNPNAILMGPWTADWFPRAAEAHAHTVQQQHAALQAFLSSNAAGDAPPRGPTTPPDTHATTGSARSPVFITRSVISSPSMRGHNDRSPPAMRGDSAGDGMPSLDLNPASPRAAATGGDLTSPAPQQQQLTTGWFIASADQGGPGEAQTGSGADGDAPYAFTPVYIPSVPAAGDSFSADLAIAMQLVTAGFDVRAMHDAVAGGDIPAAVAAALPPFANMGTVRIGAHMGGEAQPATATAGTEFVWPAELYRAMRRTMRPLRASLSAASLTSITSPSSVDDSGEAGDSPRALSDNRDDALASASAVKLPPPMDSTVAAPRSTAFGWSLPPSSSTPGSTAGARAPSSTPGSAATARLPGGGWGSTGGGWSAAATAASRAPALILTPAVHARVNAVSDDYDMTEIIGDGGYAFVRKAMSRRTQPPVECVVKCIRKRYLVSEEERDSVTREVEIHRSLQPPHPHIVTLWEAYEDKDHVYLVMERLAGGDLANYMRNKCVRAFSEGQTRIIIDQLLDALEYLHSRGILHADIKPSNILIATTALDADVSSASTSSVAAGDAMGGASGSVALHMNAGTVSMPSTQSDVPTTARTDGVDATSAASVAAATAAARFAGHTANGMALTHFIGNVKLCDFGAARRSRDARYYRLTKDVGLVPWTSVAGTMGYISPEILNRRSYSTPVDQWSVGIIMYELLSGFPPFYPYSQCTTTPVSFPSPMWDTVSEEAKALCRALLAIDPNKRLSATRARAHPWFAM